MSYQDGAASIDEVISRLDDIIARSIVERSRLGFFAALYRTVTASVSEGIKAGRFEDAARMERLDVRFANRYLSALARYRAGDAPAACWRVAFDTAARWKPIILQHLLLGMNAHINLDLGIAAAGICPGEQLPSLKNDFDEVNAILADLTQATIDEMSRLSPWIRLLDHIDPEANVAVINFSISKARQQAWRLAERLAPLPEAQWAPIIEEVDGLTCALGALVANPVGKILGAGLWIIRSRETGDPARITSVLSRSRDHSGAPVAGENTRKY